MAKTREKKFISLMQGFTKSINEVSYSKPKMEDIIHSKYEEECINIFQKLGGISDNFPINIGGYDFIIDKKIVELDEEAHFNCYRKTTLLSKIYENNKYVTSKIYSEYCDKFESACLQGRSFGGYWTNSSTEKQFGKASPNGILSGNGSPRWKQRAYYDFIKDLIPFIYNIPVIRISIYDSFSTNENKISVNQILETLDKKNHI